MGIPYESASTGLGLSEPFSYLAAGCSGLNMQNDMPLTILADPECMNKRGKAAAHQVRTSVEDLVSTSIKLTPQNSMIIPWTITRPYLFVLFRKDQLDAAVKANKKLVVRVAVSSKDELSSTFDNLGPYTFGIEQFSKIEPMADKYRDVYIVGAVHNMGDHGFDNPEQVLAIRELTQKWGQLQSDGRSK